MIGTYIAELQALCKDMRDMFVALLCFLVSYIYCASFSGQILLTEADHGLDAATATLQFDGSFILYSPNRATSKLRLS